MSFIRSTIKCPCGKLMNVSGGSFGGGMPKACAFCKKEEKFEFVYDGWYADKNGEFDEVFEKGLNTKTP